MANVTANRIAMDLGSVNIATDVESRKQLRRVQNRKNQRAHRQRIKTQDLEPAKKPRPFQVTRWRIDEFDDFVSPAVSSAVISRALKQSPLQTYYSQISEPSPMTVFGRSPSEAERSDAATHIPQPLEPPSVLFPFSTDHLLHLIQYNVFRGFVANKRTLNILLTGWTKTPHSPTTCPISGPYLDDTNIYPLNPNIPDYLFPTRLQQTRAHSYFINLFPFPEFRDNLIKHDGRFDVWALLQDLIGELMGTIPLGERQNTPTTITLSSYNSKEGNVSLTRQYDDEVTAGRRGLIVWGEPYDMHSWEATPGFLKTWAWAVKGCHGLIESTNHWRAVRGEEPLQIAV